MEYNNQRAKLIPEWIWVLLVISFPGSLLYLTRMISGRTALMSASASNDKHLVELLIKQGADVNLYDDNNSCALRVAVNTGNIEIARILIKHGADIQNLKRLLRADSMIYRSKNPIDQANFNDFKNRDKIITVLLNENKQKN